MAKLIIDYKLCDLCGLCVKYCPTYALLVKDNKLVVEDDKCIECYACIPLCPRKALRIGETDP